MFCNLALKSSCHLLTAFVQPLPQMLVAAAQAILSMVERAYSKFPADPFCWVRYDRQFNQRESETLCRILLPLRRNRRDAVGYHSGNRLDPTRKRHYRRSHQWYRRHGRSIVGCGGQYRRSALDAIKSFLGSHLHPSLCATRSAKFIPLGIAAGIESEHIPSQSHARHL